MERLNDALGRTFVETRPIVDANGNVTGREPVAAERVYSIAGYYTEPLSDEEARARIPKPKARPKRTR